VQSLLSFSLSLSLQSAAKHASSTSCAACTYRELQCLLSSLGDYPTPVLRTAPSHWVVSASYIMIVVPNPPRPSRCHDWHRHTRVIGEYNPSNESMHSCSHLSRCTMPSPHAATTTHWAVASHPLACSTLWCTIVLWSVLQPWSRLNIYRGPRPVSTSG